jgi:uncharacterized SAM-binding protein YcdF (DUF218 family)
VAQTVTKFALFRRRECLLPTCQGWACIALVVLIIFGGLATSIHPFLAVSQPGTGGVLVVEGWLPDRALQRAIHEFRDRGYQRIYVTGIPVELGGPLMEYRTYADISAAILLKLGMETNLVQAVPAPRVSQDRTYTSAVSLKRWFQQHEEPAYTLTVITEGTHARRSRLLFSKAFGREYVVGVISVPPETYDPKRWYAASAGVRGVISEALAYGYARFLFWPKRAD